MQTCCRKLASLRRARWTEPKKSEKRRYIISHNPTDATRLRLYFRHHPNIEVLGNGGRYVTTILTTPITTIEINEKVRECWGEIRELKEGEHIQPPRL